MLLLWDCFAVTKPLSQIQKSTLWPLQDANPTPSLGGFGLNRTSKEYSAFANQETLCIALCENKESIDAIGEIASVPGLDVVWVGAGNLAAEHGWPGGSVMDPIVSEMCQNISKAGKIVGAGSRHGSAERMREDDIRFVVTIAHDLFRESFVHHLRGLRVT